MLLLLQHIASLPALSSLSMHSFCLSGGVARALAAATGLSQLQLNECDVRDDDVEVLAASLSRLQRLALNWNFKLHLERLATLTRLQGLRELQVCCGCPNYGAVLEELQRKLPLLRVTT
jgi:hypothetical protein